MWPSGDRTPGAPRAVVKPVRTEMERRLTSAPVHVATEPHHQAVACTVCDGQVKWVVERASGRVVRKRCDHCGSGSHPVREAGRAA